MKYCSDDEGDWFLDIDKDPTMEDLGFALVGGQKSEGLSGPDERAAISVVCQQMLHEDSSRKALSLDFSLNMLRQERRSFARLVAQGFSQVSGINYFETFAPVAKPTSIRTALATAAHLDMELH